MSADTFIDGGGVFADQPLGEGVRIRFRPTGESAEDVTVCIVAGRLLVSGMNRPLSVQFLESNCLQVVPAHWEREVA